MYMGVCVNQKNVNINIMYHTDLTRLTEIIVVFYESSVPEECK